MKPTLRILEDTAQMRAVEEIQRQVWGMSDVVPHHLLLTAAHNGGLLIGAFHQERMIGFVFGFLGLSKTAPDPGIKHCSHMLAVLPEYQGRGIGFALKRAQWQMVRRQGIQQITWTYDPLMSRNAYLNIAHLGAVSNTYLANLYGEMQDDLNQGLPSDRLQVDLWVNSTRVRNRMSNQPRKKLDLAHYLAGNAQIINPTRLGEGGWPQPPESSGEASPSTNGSHKEGPALFLIEIPSDFLAIKAADRDLALQWRQHTRALFEDLFARGYLITDFIHLGGQHPRSFYILSDGERTLGA